MPTQHFGLFDALADQALAFPMALSRRRLGSLPPRSTYFGDYSFQWSLIVLWPRPLTGPRLRRVPREDDRNRRSLFWLSGLTALR